MILPGLCELLQCELSDLLGAQRSCLVNCETGQTGDGQGPQLVEFLFERFRPRFDHLVMVDIPPRAYSTTAVPSARFFRNHAASSFQIYRLRFSGV